jgi:Flp pilus assembly protein TadG
MRNLIVGLARPLLRMLGRDERGGVAVIVAVLIGGGVLLGIGALVIDVGQIYQNRAELQSGAEAGALAVAGKCAAGACPAGAAQYTLATQYADANASALTGHQAQVTLVCGHDPNAVLTGCTTGTTTSGSDLIDCPPSPSSGNYVDVHSATQTPSGTVLPPVFGRMLLGNRGYSGTTVAACAQAEWGAPTSADTIAFTISACSWYVYTNNGTSFASPPPYPPNTVPPASDDHILYEHGSPNSTTGGCPEDNSSGADGPGNFGETTPTVSGGCTTLISNGTYGGDSGQSNLHNCATTLAADQANKTLVFMPVYSSVTGSGANLTFTLLGFAAFVITGYHITGSVKASDWLNPANNCTGNKFCINGYFTQGLIPSASGPGGTQLGASVVVLSG